jgi:hypothetical protein
MCDVLANRVRARLSVTRRRKKRCRRICHAHVKRNLKLIQLRTQTQFEFDTPAYTVIR